MRWLTLLGIGTFSAISFLASRINGWFDINTHTLSKMGRPDLTPHFWIFWLALIAGGSMILSHGIWMILKGNRLQVLGGAYISLAAFFMVLIAPVHDGLKFHDELAFLAFMLFYPGCFFYSLGVDGKLPKVLTLLVWIMALVGLRFPWKSTGWLEIYGLSLIAVDSILLGIYHLP